ncbi:hypothetical protein BN440_2105 [Erwinia amylovora MR1]|nr:hypothetical protein BN440_2105 [Erwinia amylovora MR1]
MALFFAVTQAAFAGLRGFNAPQIPSKIHSVAFKIACFTISFSKIQEMRCFFERTSNFNHPPAKIYSL